MANHFGRIHGPSWGGWRRHKEGEARRTRRGGLRDRFYSIMPGDAGLEARAWSRIRKADLPQDGLGIEAWHGTLTVRGEVPAEHVPQYREELARVRGTRELLNFLRPT